MNWLGIALTQWGRYRNQAMRHIHHAAIGDHGIANARHQRQAFVALRQNVMHFIRRGPYLLTDHVAVRDPIARVERERGTDPQIFYALEWRGEFRCGLETQHMPPQHHILARAGQCTELYHAAS